MAEIAVQVLEKRWLEQLPACEELARVAVETALQQLEMADSEFEVSLALADDETVRALNRDYRQKDKPTNVLAFPSPSSPLADGPRLLGDIVVAFETVGAEAEAQAKSLDDHLRHLVIHGLLHLLGFDHETDEEATRMEQMETHILRQLDVPDPYDQQLSEVMEMSRG